MKFSTFLAGLCLFLPCAAQAQITPDEQAFRDTYKQLVETDTSYPRGSCTTAAEKMAARLKAAGFADADVHMFGLPDKPRENGLVATLRGSSRKAVLYVAHIDVVDANRADWARDPFMLTEENGYFYGRGVSDDKAMAASLVDSLVRLKTTGFRPKRAIKVALTCGEETATAFNGAEYLASQARALVDADFALIPSGGARLDENGKPLSITIQAGEKINQNFTLEATAPGGHSSRPVDPNAVYRLAAGLQKLSRVTFPIAVNEATRQYLRKTAASETGARRAALDAFNAAPSDPMTAAAVAAADPAWNGMMRTTCIPTVMEAGQAINALPEKATATINCRLLPGESVDALQRKLIAALDDPSLSLTFLGARSPTATSPPLTATVVAPIEKLARAFWPGTPIIPNMLTGATDARYFNAAELPAYGLTVVFNDPDGNGIHGRNERVRVKSVLDGRAFIYRLMQVYAR